MHRAEQAWEEEEEEEYYDEEFEEDYEEEDDDYYDGNDVIVTKGGKGGGGKRARAEQVEIGGWNRNPFLVSADAFRSQKTLLMNKITKWRSDSKGKQSFARQPVKALLPDLLAYLLASYRSEVESNSFVPHGRLHLIFGDGQEVHCVQATGELRFGWGILTGRIDDTACSRYALEKEPMKAICRCKEDVLMWLVLHEFLHLFNGNEAHTQEFFARITEAAKKHSFLFTSIP